MPIYEYKCRKCGKEYELFQKISDPAVKSCKFCRGPVHKLISVSSFHLKGTGWYVTDRSKKKRKAIYFEIKTHSRRRFGNQRW